MPEFSFNQFTTPRLTEALDKAAAEVGDLRSKHLKGIVEAWIAAAKAELEERDAQARRRAFWPLLDAELSKRGAEPSGFGECDHVFRCGYPVTEAADVIEIYRRAQLRQPEAE